MSPKPYVRAPKTLQAQVAGIGLMGCPTKRDGKAVEGVRIFLGGSIGENAQLASEFEKASLSTAVALKGGGIRAPAPTLLPRRCLLPLLRPAADSTSSASPACLVQRCRETG